MAPIEKMTDVNIAVELMQDAFQDAFDTAILISADLRSEKPSRDFFEKVSVAAGSRPDEVLYVGDRVDNDVIPARSVGMQTALIRRGPWGYLHAEWPQAAEADAIIDSLTEIPDLLG